MSNKEGRGDYNYVSFKPAGSDEFIEIGRLVAPPVVKLLTVDEVGHSVDDVIKPRDPTRTDLIGKFDE